MLVLAGAGAPRVRNSIDVELPLDYSFFLVPKLKKERAMPRSSFFSGGVLFLFVALATQTGVAISQDKIPGATEFLNSCSACHGSDGSGNGPVAAYLTVKPPDLTRLSERNNGQFPFVKVFMIIDGRTGARSHGTEAMPVWGDRYRQQIDPKNMNPLGSEQIIRGRILELVNYLASIQKGSDKSGIVR